MGSREAAYRRQLQKLVPAWFEADQELARQLEEEDGDPGPSDPAIPIERALGKPCTARDIAALESFVKAPLPPSYRAYLSLYGSGPKSFGSPLGPGEHRSKALRRALRAKSDLFDELAKSNPIAAGAIPFIADGDSREMLLFVHARPRAGRVRGGGMVLVEYDITEPVGRYADLVAYFRRSLATTRAIVQDMIRDKSRRGIRTTRQAIDAVLDFGVTKSIRKPALKSALLRLGGQLPGGGIPTEATIKELRDGAESARFFRALRALPGGVPERLALSLVDAANDLLLQRDTRERALPAMELLFDAAPDEPCQPGDRAHAWWLEVLNSALHRSFAAKQRELGERLAKLAKRHARGNALIPHNAACAFAAVGRYDDALAMCRLAVRMGYAHLDRLSKDKDLGALRNRREFKELFSP
jgi:hypothetical protein